MIENMNNMEDIMTKIYDAFNVFTNRPIIMVDNATFFTYGSIFITTTVLAIATIYDEGDVEDNYNYGKAEEPNGPSPPIFAGPSSPSSTEPSQPNSMIPSLPSFTEPSQPNSIIPSTNDINEYIQGKMNQNVGGKKHRKQKRTIKKRND